MTARLPLTLSALLLLASVGLLGRSAQQASTDSVAAAPDLQTAISRLGSLDYATRTNSARIVRRAPAPDAVTALAAAVKDSADQFIRYRALVLLTGFGDRRTGEVMRSVAGDRNDRLREVAYRWIATRPQEGSAPMLLATLQTEQAEFVRPALVKALAAMGNDPQVQRALVAEVSRGQDFFRLGVIDALGEFKARYALEAVTAVARVEGPLQDDAVLALGRIGDRSSEDTLLTLSTTATEVAMAGQAALCLLGSDCPTRIRAITDVMITPGAKPEAVRGAVTALSVLGAAGSDLALSTLADLAGAARTQDIATVGFGGSALRSPERVLAWLVRQPVAQQTSVIDLLRSAFERFEEDFSEEQFFAATRAAYWRAAEGSRERDLMATLIQKLEF